MPVNTQKWRDPLKDSDYYRGMNDGDSSDSGDDTRRRYEGGRSGGSKEGAGGRKPSSGFMKELATSHKAREFYGSALSQVQKEEAKRRAQSRFDDAERQDRLDRVKQKKDRRRLSTFEVLWAGIVAYGTVEALRRTWSHGTARAIFTRVVAEADIMFEDGDGGGGKVDSPLCQLAFEVLPPLPVHMIAVAWLFFSVVAFSHFSKLHSAYHHSKKHDHSLFKSNGFGLLYLVCCVVCLGVVMGHALLGVLVLWSPHQQDGQLQNPSSPFNAASASHVCPAGQVPVAIPQNSSSSYLGVDWAALFPLTSIAALCLAAGAIHRMSRVVV